MVGAALVCYHTVTHDQQLYLMIQFSARVPLLDFIIFFRFIIIETNVGAEFNNPMVIEFHRHFPSGAKNNSIYHDYPYAATFQ